MRRTAFVKVNKDKWKRFEDLLEGENKPNPDQLADLFIQVTDDLAFSHTQYPDTDTTRYLNHLASKVHQHIYKNKKENTTRIITFWTRELPLVVYQYRKALLYSFLVFSVAVLIGALSAANDTDFVRLILGDEYVDTTLDNIQNGQPMGIYGSMRGSDMFFLITFNNIRVAFTAFIWGGFMGGIPLCLFLSFGTAFMLFYNGVMLGSFQYFFYQHGLFTESFLTIWIHGTLEISAIIIAGAAGIAAGNSLLFPGTYTRMASFQRGFKDGLKIVTGLVPVFITAGFLESYVTRLFDMSPFLKALIIVLSLGFIIFYFIYYPLKLSVNNGK